MSVTSSDVARRARVSQATVSYVLNDTPGQRISEETRNKVLRIARELGYRPNAAARSLRTGSGEAVLLPLPGQARSYVASQLVDACSDALMEGGLTLVTDYAAYADSDTQLDAWMRLRPAAVIDLLIAHDDPVRPALQRSGIRLVSASHAGETWESTSDAFSIDARSTQLGYLLDRGHRRIALAAPPRMHSDRRVERHLTTRLRSQAARAGAELMRSTLTLDSDGARSLVDGWCDPGLPDAVCAYSDDYAIAVLTALTAAGVNVPGDVAVIGVDDVPAAAYVTPALTTVAAEFDALAAALADAVGGLLSGRGRPVEIPVPGHRLVIRESA
jgi:DNA-binding LacI/PurR family transcriptional regulator